MSRAVSTLGLLWLALAATGCLTADDEGPILSVELYWDEDVDKGFFGGECHTAGVDAMQWTLFRVGEDGDEEVSSGGQPTPDRCSNGLDIVDPEPGEYELDVSGFDQDGLERWHDRCSGLIVTRFDIAYLCEIVDR